MDACYCTIVTYIQATQIDLCYYISYRCIDDGTPWSLLQAYSIHANDRDSSSCTFVAGLADTFPSFPVRGPFLPHVPGFQLPSDSVFLLKLWPSSRALPLHLHFHNCSDVSVSSLLLMTMCPNHSNLLMTIANGSTFASSKISSFLLC